MASYSIIPLRFKLWNSEFLLLKTVIVVLTFQRRWQWFMIGICKKDKLLAYEYFSLWDNDSIFTLSGDDSILTYPWRLFDAHLPLAMIRYSPTLDDDSIHTYLWRWFDIRSIWWTPNSPCETVNRMPLMQVVEEETSAWIKKIEDIKIKVKLSLRNSRPNRSTYL